MAHMKKVYDDLIIINLYIDIVDMKANVFRVHKNMWRLYNLLEVFVDYR